MIEMLNIKIITVSDPTITSRRDRFDFSESNFKIR